MPQKRSAFSVELAWRTWPSALTSQAERMRAAAARGLPAGLSANVTGRDPDGWITAPAPDKEAIGAYNQYSTRGGRAGTVVVRVSRTESGLDAPARVKVYV
ncbi:MAG: hypothetical protein ABR607_17425, partial [Pyrinomonadaceae bacterium]